MADLIINVGVKIVDGQFNTLTYQNGNGPITDDADDFITLVDQGDTVQWISSDLNLVLKGIIDNSDFDLFSNDPNLSNNFRGTISDHLTVPRGGWQPENYSINYEYDGSPGTRDPKIKINNK